MKKRILFYFLIATIFLGLFAFYIQYLFWQDMDFGSFLSSIMYSFIATGSDKLISINLYNKSLVMIEGGNLVRRDKISAAGNPRISPTPTGNFSILTKSKRLVSNLSGLVMPYSLRIRGPYFLHGPPTYKNGTPYYSEYSSGCVRLGPGLIEEVYNWADLGTKVMIYNSNLVKSAENPPVYYLRQDGSRESIPDQETFLKRGFKWKNVKVISLAELVSIPLVSPAEAVEF